MVRPRTNTRSSNGARNSVDAAPLWYGLQLGEVAEDFIDPATTGYGTMAFQELRPCFQTSIR